MHNESNQRFPKSRRLLRQAEFDAVYDSEYFAADSNLVVKAIDNGTSKTRLGLSVSRKVGNAVVRNRWKRVIREVFRLQQHDLPPGLDLVVRPRKGARCEYDRISRSLPKLLARLHRNITRDRDGERR